MTTVDLGTGWIPESFSNFERSLNGSKETPFHSVRQEAIKELLNRGFPTTKEEEWKYTNILPAIKSGFNPVTTVASEVVARDLEPYLLKEIASSRIVFLNGNFVESLSVIKELPKGVSVERLSNVFSGKVTGTEGELVTSLLKKNSSTRERPFTTLNTGFVRDGVFIKIDRGVRTESPIHLVFATTKDAAGALITPRVLIRADRDSELSVIETHVSLDEATYLSSGVVQVYLKEGASVDHYKLQLESPKGVHVSDLVVDHDAKSRFRTHGFGFGGGLVRNEVEYIFNGERCDSTLNGLTVIDNEQHIDNHTVIDHAKPNCESRELFKGIYADKSRGVFSGTIIVREDAQKTNAFQANRTLLLSDEASVEAKPQLKIWADDVKCTHGATVGQLDEEALFYLRSRGISKEEATHLLIHAFASDILREVRSPKLREVFEAHLSKKLKQDFSA